MSARARGARRLASLLTRDCGGQSGDVQVTYQNRNRSYVVRWRQGPTIPEMQAFAHRHIPEVPELDLSKLRWDRREPAQGSR